MKKRILLSSVTALIVALCCAFTVTAYAHDVPDTTKSGSIRGTMLYGTEPVGGGTLTLFKVADVTENNGNYSFTLTDAFAGSGASLDNFEDKTLASMLAAYAESRGISGTTISIDSDGAWSAEGLELGLYLVVQYEPAYGFEAISPFIVSVPMYDEDTDKYIYDVNAQPKLEALTQETTTTVTGEDTPKADTPKKDTLPNTGQLLWPIPVLAVLGAVLLLAGLKLRCSNSRRNKHGR